MKLSCRTLSLVGIVLFTFSTFHATAAQVLIAGVPNYDQNIFPIGNGPDQGNDCVPVACAMLQGYYDAHGWPRLIPFGTNDPLVNAWGVDTVVRRYKQAMPYTPDVGVPNWWLHFFNHLGDAIVTTVAYFDPGANFSREDDDITLWSRIKDYINNGRPCVLSITEGGAYSDKPQDTYKFEGGSALGGIYDKYNLPTAHSVCAIGWSDDGGDWLICNMGWSVPNRGWINRDGNDDWYISQIASGGTSSGEDDDAYEDNDSINSAKHVAAGSISGLRCLDTFVEGGQYLAGLGDWYKISVSAGRSISASISFAGANGDLNMRVFDPNQVDVGSSTGAGNTEEVSVTSTISGDYYIYVYENANQQNPNYSMTLNTVANPVAPTITAVSPVTLPSSASPQLVSILGANFLPSSDPNASSLVFYDPANNAYPRTPTFVSSGELRYNITVQSAVGQWKVKVLNGSTPSELFTFNVASGSSALTGVSISGPSTVPENGVVQFTATALFSDGSSQTVSPTWSENSSATTISASGQLSAGSVNANTIVSVSASFTSGGITKSASADITVVNSGSGGGSQTTDVIVNGTFEAGTTPWAPSGYADVASLSYPHGGSWYSYVGNANNAAGSIAQFFPIPASASAATLKFYIDIVTAETSTSTKYDTLKVDLATGSDQYVGTIAEFSNLDKGDNVNGTYVLKTYNIMPLLNAYKGESLFLIFSGTTDGSSSTIFRVDDVTLEITTPTPVTLTGLGISGPSAINEGRGDTYYAQAIFSDGTTQTISPNSWSENSSATTIGASGFLSAGQIGADTPVTVSASYTYGGTTKQASKLVTIIDTNAPVAFTALAISGPASLNENSSGQFTATALFSDGSSQIVSPTWTENSAAASISSSGLLTAGNIAGDSTVTVSASFTIGSVTRTGNQDVSLLNIPDPVIFTALTIEGPQSLNERNAAQYTARASFSDSSTQVVNPTWSENTDLTSISPFGLLSAGEVTSDMVVAISASYSINGTTRQATHDATVWNVVSAVPHIALSQASLSQGVQVGGNASSRTLGIRNGGGGTLSYSISISPGASWVSVSPTNGSSSGEEDLIALNFATTNMPIGTSNATITISAAGADNSPVSIPVSVTATVLPENIPYEAKWASPMNSLNADISATDENGGVLLGATFTGSTTAGGQTLTASGTPSDIYLAKLSTNGQPLWVRQYGGTNEEQLGSCVRHPAGGWVIGGQFKVTGVFDTQTVASAGNRDAFLARLDDSGNVLWVRRAGGTKVDYGEKVAVDAAGNCYLIGEFTTSATFSGGATTLTAVGTRFDIFVAKYSPAGDFLWAKSAGGGDYDTVDAAAAEPAGNLYVSGRFTTNATFGPYTLSVQGSPLQTDAYLVKFDTSGSVQWAKRFGEPAGGNASEGINFISLPSAGGCYFGGYYEGPMAAEGKTLPASGSLIGSFIGKINNGGTLEWLTASLATTVLYSALCDASSGQALQDGGLIVGGRFEGKLGLGATTITNPTSTAQHYFAKYDSQGAARWGIAVPANGYFLHYLGTSGADRVRFMARFDGDVSLPGLDPITSSPDDTLLVELGPKDPNRIDTDGDGIPDWWETLHGLNLGVSSDGNIDTDGDGFRNWQEYVAGTDPTNARSAFGIATFGTAPSRGIVIKWPSASNRVYRLTRASDLLAGTNGFFVLPGASNLPATPAENTYTDVVEGVGPYFYKIDVSQ